MSLGERGRLVQYLGDEAQHGLDLRGGERRKIAKRRGGIPVVRMAQLL